MSITEVPDQIFFEKMMSDSFAIELENGLFSLPINGGILNLFPTKHTIGIQSVQGLEILNYIGLDTVNLKGEDFKVYVKKEIK